MSSDQEALPKELPQLYSAGRKHKQVLEGMDVFTAARLRMKHVYDNFDKVVVMCSGGKDSTAALYIARDAAAEVGRLPVEVVFADEEVIYPETIELMLRHHADKENFNVRWLCIPARYRNACSEKEPHFIPWDPSRRELWTHEPPPFAEWPAGRDVVTWTNPPHPANTALRYLYPKDAFPVLVHVVGLRAQESFVRYGGLMSSGSYLARADARGVVNCRPVYDWSARDVWLAIRQFGWDYNAAYEKLWRAGANPTTARVAPLFGAEAVTNLNKIMRYWPAFWHKIRARVRGAHAMAIYDGALHKVTTFGDETWEQAAQRYFDALSEENQVIQKPFIEEVLRRHNQHSTEPLPQVRPCSECNLSWKWMARAIALADRHGRMYQRNKSLALKPQ